MTSRMTATEELRRLLDGRGVEWTYGDGTVSFSDGKHWCHAWAYNDDTMCVSIGYFTPEQAVEATLGSDLEAENEKLRELVWDMWDWLAPTAVGGGAPLKGLRGRMHELGVDE